MKIFATQQIRKPKLNSSDDEFEEFFAKIIKEDSRIGVDFSALGFNHCHHRTGNRGVNLQHFTEGIDLKNKLLLSPASPLGAVHSERVDSKMEEIDKVADRDGIESRRIPSRMLKLLMTHNKKITSDSLIHLPISCERLLFEKYQHDKNEGCRSSLVVAPAKLDKISDRDGLESGRKSMIPFAHQKPGPTPVETMPSSSFSLMNGPSIR